jgi:hypothetical protein
MTHARFTRSGTAPTPTTRPNYITDSSPLGKPTLEYRIVRAVRRSQRNGMTSSMIYRKVESQTPNQVSWAEVEDILRMLVARRTFIVFSRRFRFNGPC